VRVHNIFGRVYRGCEFLWGQGTPFWGMITFLLISFVKKIGRRMHMYPLYPNSPTQCASMSSNNIIARIAGLR